MKIGEGATFQTDLQIGERVEKLVLMIIQHKYPQAYKRAGYFKEYDLVIPEIGKTVEVKAHLISRTNYWVETGYDGKPSGIITSTADYYVFVDMTGLTWCDTNKLREALPFCGYGLTTHPGTHDSLEKTGYAVKKEWLWGHDWVKHILMDINKYLGEI